MANVEDSLGQNSMYLLATSYLKINDKNGAKNAFLICSSKSQNIAQKEISLFNYGKFRHSSFINYDNYHSYRKIKRALLNYENTSYCALTKDNF